MAYSRVEVSHNSCCALTILYSANFKLTAPGSRHVSSGYQFDSSKSYAETTVNITREAALAQAYLRGIFSDVISVLGIGISSVIPHSFEKGMGSMFTTKVTTAGSKSRRDA